MAGSAQLINPRCGHSYRILNETPGLRQLTGGRGIDMQLSRPMAGLAANS
jgi:hypothetical protein